MTPRDKTLMIAKTRGEVFIESGMSAKTLDKFVVVYDPAMGH
ncbi:hypothetical protein [Sphingomonas sp.]